MHKIVKAAILSAVTVATLSAAGGAAQATCYVNWTAPVPLGVCESHKPEPGRGYCVNVAVYTTTPTDPEQLVCTGV